MGYLLVGIGFLAIFTVIWIGVVRPRGFLFTYVPWTILPGLGVILTAFGLERVGVLPDDSPVGPISLLLLIAGAVLLVWQPSWWAPRWYREAHR